MPNFTSLVDRLAGAAPKPRSAAATGDRRARWLVGADAVFDALTGFVLSVLIFLTVAGVIVSMGQ